MAGREFIAVDHLRIFILVIQRKCNIIQNLTVTSKTDGHNREVISTGLPCISIGNSNNLSLIPLMV